MVTAQHWLAGLAPEVGADEQNFEDGGSQQEFVELPDGTTLAIGGYTRRGSEDGHAQESPPSKFGGATAQNGRLSHASGVQQVGSLPCQEVA